MRHSNGKRSGLDNRCSNEQIGNIVKQSPLRHAFCLPSRRFARAHPPHRTAERRASWGVAVRNRRARPDAAGRRPGARRDARNPRHRGRRGGWRRRDRVYRRHYRATWRGIGAVVRKAARSLRSGAESARARSGADRYRPRYARRRSAVGTRRGFADAGHCRSGWRDRSAADGRRSPVAARRRALRHSRLFAAALAHRRGSGGRTHPAERGDDALAGRAPPLFARGRRTRNRPAALASRVAALPWRRGGGFVLGFRGGR